MKTVPPLIAVVDDEDSVRRAFQRLLRSAGLGVETFPSGADFLQSLSAGLPDCVVLDVCMPQMDGFEVQVRLAQAGVRVPVIVITGQDTPGSRERALAAGAVAFFHKPVDDQLLLDAIATALASVSMSTSPSGAP